MSSCQRARARETNRVQSLSRRARGVCGEGARGARNVPSGTHPHREKGVRPRRRILRRRRHPRDARSDLPRPEACWLSQIRRRDFTRASGISRVGAGRGAEVISFSSSRCPDSFSAALPPPRPRASRRAVSNGRVSFRLATERRFLEARSNPRTPVLPSSRVLEASRNPVLARRARWERRLRVRHGGPGDDGPGPPRFHAELGQPRRTCRGSTSGASTRPPTASVSLPSPRAFSLLPTHRRPSLTESASLPTAAHRRARRRATG